MVDGPVRHVPARGRGDAGWTVTGRGARADRDARPYRVRMCMTGRRAVDTRAACPVSGGGHRSLLRDLIRAGGSSRQARGRVAQAPAR